MISLCEIHKSLVKLLETEFSTPLSFDIWAQDFQETLQRPSLKIILENGTARKYNSLSKERILLYRIYFFAQNAQRPKIENMNMQEKLENLFLDGIFVKEDFHIPIDDLEFETTDGVLVCTFQLRTIELLPQKDTNEMMETLHISL